MKNKYSNKNIFIKSNNCTENNNSSEELKKLLFNNSDSSEKKINCNNINKSNSKKIENKVSDKNSDQKDKNENIIQKVYNSVMIVLNKLKINLIEGEIISYKISDSNAYFTLKNKENVFNGIFWNIILAVKFNEYKILKEGDQIKINGFFSISKKNLNIYFTIKDCNKIGLGQYLNFYEEYRKKIIDLNWDKNKKNIVLFPYNIGIITSLEGAAIQDMLQIFKNDNLLGKIIIKNAVVQGQTCPKSVIQGINFFENNYNNIDLLIITRGGGSYEDLVGFSNWELLEKLHYCKLTTISAIGHQIDNQLSDEVCDYNFATPSIAAKFLIEFQKNKLNNFLLIKQKLESIFDKLNNTISYFKNINYDQMIKNFINNENNKKIIIIDDKIKNILNKYNTTKNTFLEKITLIKPSIFRKEEITNLNDFIDETGNEVKPKKIDIYLINGKITIEYKIIKHEFY